MSETTPREDNSRPRRDSMTFTARVLRAQTRRGVVFMTLIGGAMLLISSTMTWVTAYGLGSTSSVQEVAITGADLVETVTAMGLVGLAAGLAVTIAKRLGRALIGSVLFGASIIALLAIRGVLADPESSAASALGEITGTTAAAQRYELSLAVWIGFAGALLLLISALLLLIVSHRWPDRRSKKYQLNEGAPETGQSDTGQSGTGPHAAGTGDSAGPGSGPETLTGTGPGSGSGSAPGQGKTSGRSSSQGETDPDEFDIWDGLSDGKDPTDPGR